MEIKNASDGRFFPGYVWVSSDPDCKVGLCYKTDSERSAAEWIAAPKWYHRGNVVTVYTKTQPYDVPQRHIIEC